jgi:hypothetical protein
MIGALLVHVFVFGAGPQTALIGVLLVLLYVIGSSAIRRSVA